VPGVAHPDWLRHRSHLANHDLRAMFKSGAAANAAAASAAAAAGGDGAPAAPRGGDVGELEDFGGNGGGAAALGAAGRARVVRRARSAAMDADGATPMDADDADGADGAADDGADDVGSDGGVGADATAAADAAATALSADGMPAPITREWLASRKRGRWRELREAHKRARRLAARGGRAPAPPLGAGGAGAPPPAVGGGVAALARASAGSAMRAPWQVVSLAPTARLGELRAWVLIDGAQLHAVTIAVPRELFINCRTADALDASCAGFSAASRVLPHGAVLRHMVRFEVAEPAWAARGGALGSWLQDVDILGIYQAHVPPLFKAVLELGAVCAVSQHGRHRSLHDGFALGELQGRGAEGGGGGGGGGAAAAALSGYLDSPKLRTAVLYATLAGPGERGVVALYEPYARPARLALWVLGAGGARGEAAPSVEAVRARLAAVAECVAAGMAAAELDLIVEGAPSVDAALGRAARRLDGARALAGGAAAPLIVLANLPSALSTAALRARVPALERGGPVVRIPPHGPDADEWRFKLGALAQLGAIEVALGRCALAGEWWRSALAFAKFANVPVGCVGASGGERGLGAERGGGGGAGGGGGGGGGDGSDHALLAADVLFARRLQADGHVLWASPGPAPDLGGPGRSLDARVDEATAAAAADARLNCPALHRGVCVELRLSQLAVAAVMESRAVIAVESAAGGAAVSGAGSVLGLDESLSTLPAFRALKQLVQGWYRELHRGQGAAALLLDELYRWLASPAALLHDPSLHLLLSRLMHKVAARTLCVCVCVRGVCVCVCLHLLLSRLMHKVAARTLCVCVCVCV
jgi:DNA polymerase epsilon subunit 1